MIRVSCARRGPPLRLPAAILMACLVLTPAASAPFLHDRTVRIFSDRGGQLMRYALKAKTWRKAGTRIEFAGRCDSACTLYLSVPRPNACITRRARFGFHLPYGSTPKANKLATRYMMRNYPGWVRNWIAANGGLTRRVKVMDYRYASRYLKTCSA